MLQIAVRESSAQKQDTPVAEMWSPAKGAIVLLTILAVLTVLPSAAIAFGFPALVPLATRILIYSIAAVSLDLILGYGGLVSFGHAAFFGIGGYVVGISYAHFRANETLFGIPIGTDQLLITVAAAMLLAGIVAVFIGSLALRTSGVYFIMITLAFAQMIYFLFSSIAAYGGDDGMSVRRRNTLPFVDTANDVTFYFISLAALVCVIALCRRIVGSRFGRVLAGARQDERRMTALGVSTFPIKLAAFAIAGAGAGLAGALMANQAKFVSPDMLHWTKSGELMIMVILGGAGTLFGPILGALVLVSLETVLARITEHWQLIMGPILILAILLVPGGLGKVLSRRLFRP